MHAYRAALPAILLVLVLAAGCGESTPSPYPDVTGRVDDTAVFFLRYSAPVGADEITAAVRLTVDGENILRTTVATPSGENVALVSNAGGSHLEKTISGDFDTLQPRFADGAYEYTVAFVNGYALFLTETLSDPFPDFPLVTAPEEDAEEVTLTPVVEWYAVAGIDQYEVRISEEFAILPIFSLSVGGNAIIMSLAVPAGLLTYETRYRIEVRASSPQEQKESAAVRYFTTEPE